MRSLIFIVVILLSFCKKKERYLQLVSYEQFDLFVKETGYITDAEKYGGSFIQKDVFNYKIKEGATWKKPDGINEPTSKDLSVTQVSYHDAIAYCKWSNSRLPIYDEYWKLIKRDNRKVITNYNAPISPVNKVNIIGNIWEITSTIHGNSVRLAGGSICCSKNTCHGTSIDRELLVDKQTGNIHIGFAIVQ
ncbi:MAG: SUMF1/EgtB/PvdO family nonheme iron enzyme [Bacteroidota bacterium]